MKKIILLLTVLISTSSLIARNGYTLNFVTENLQGKTLEISFYVGSSRIFYSKDIVPITENTQTVFLKDTSKILGGIFKLNFIGQKASKDIIIDNGDNLTFRLSDIKMESLTALNSDKNRLFSMYPGLKNDSIITTFLANHPKSAGAVYFQLEKKRKKIPAYFARRATYQKVFWNGMDIDNQQLQYLPNIYRTLKIYTELQEINDSLYSFAMNNLLSKIKTSSNFEFFTTWFFKNMRYNQKYSIDKTFVNTYRKYFDTLKIEYENISNFKVIERSYNDVNTNIQGEVITDFKLHTKSDSLVILSRVYPKNDFTFIAFYDPDCFHCQKAMPKLSALFSDLKKNKNIKIATIGMLNAYDQMDWSTFITRNNMQSWINLYSKDPNKAYQEDYNSYSNPRFFLVDSKGILLSRSGNVNELYKIINLK